MHKLKQCIDCVIHTKKVIDNEIAKCEEIINEKKFTQDSDDNDLFIDLSKIKIPDQGANLNHENDIHSLTSSLRMRRRWIRPLTVILNQTVMKTL